MKMEFDPELFARLANRHLIWECMLRYIRGVDRMDKALVRSAFWEDASNTHGPISGTIEDFIGAWYPAQEARDLSFHMVSNQTIEFEGDTIAHCETYFLAGIHLKNDPQVEMVGGRYADVFEKRGGEWRIRTRLVLLDWQGLMDGRQMTERLATRHRGARDRSDPTYERPVRPRAAIATQGWALPGQHSKEKADD